MKGLELVYTSALNPPGTEESAVGDFATASRARTRSPRFAFSFFRRRFEKKNTSQRTRARERNEKALSVIEEVSFRVQPRTRRHVAVVLARRREGSDQRARLIIHEPRGGNVFTRCSSERQRPVFNVFERNRARLHRHQHKHEHERTRRFLHHRRRLRFPPDDAAAAAASASTTTPTTTTPKATTTTRNIRRRRRRRRLSSSRRHTRATHASPFVSILHLVGIHLRSSQRIRGCPRGRHGVRGG